MDSRLPDQDTDLPYEAPAVIYEGKLTTRAGSRMPSGFGDGFDPSLLFGDPD